LGFILFNIWKIYIGCIFTLTLLLFYPLLYILLSKENWKPSAFRVYVFWSRLLRIFCFYGVEKINEYTSTKEPKIIIANHTSYLDIFLLYSTLPQHKFVFLGKSEILSYPLVKTFFKKLNIPVYRDNRIKAARSFMVCKKALNDGWSVVIFPEGGIPDEHLPKMIPFKDGAFKLAKSCAVPILPLTFENNYKLFSDPETIFGSAYPGLARIHFHPMITRKEIEESTLDEIKQRAFTLISGVLKK